MNRGERQLLMLVVRGFVAWGGWRLICFVFGLDWSGFRQMMFGLSVVGLQYVDTLLERKARQ